MKSLCLGFLACGLVLVFIQSSGLIEAVKVKKVVKDAAKLSKKYGYLLASRKKKLYAVPFPMPLPVFIKRQQIYTQVPIIPRYVQHPQPYGAPTHSGESVSAYESMTSQPTYMELPAETASGQRSKSSGSPSSSSSSNSYQDSASSPAGSGKYLSQLASIIGQSVPVFGSSASSNNRDLMNKLLSGQAKILPPTSLISAIKSPSSAFAKYQKFQKNQHKQEGSDSSKEQDQESKYETSASSGPDSPSDTTRSPSTASSASPEGTRTSSSEMHRTRLRMRSPPGGLLASASDQRRAPIPAMYPNPMLSIATAAMAARQAPALMGRIPVNQLATANQYLNMLEPTQMGRLEQLESQSSEPSEQVADSQSPQADDDEQGQQQMEQRRQLLKLALLRERQEAGRLLEARMALARAKQIGQQSKRQTTLSQEQQQQLLAQLINHYKQNQMEQQFRQMRYLQLVQQQQLAQNSIDK